MIVLLYTYFYDISLNVLRPFFNIYNLPFLHSPNIAKIRVKVSECSGRPIFIFLLKKTGLAPSNTNISLTRNLLIDSDVK